MSERAKTYAEAHRAYLARAHPAMHDKLRKSGELDEHCRRRGVEAAEMYETIARQCREVSRPEETETERRIRLEAIPHVADECARNDLVYAL